MKRIAAMVLEEPYRVFFPLGMVAGIWGVMMWPLLYAGRLGFYPGEAHSRIMIEGFMGAFVVGFVGTAFPRLTGNRHWFAGEFISLLGLWLLAVASHSLGHVTAGDAAFSAMLVALFAGMLGRWMRGNKDTPPPGFVLLLAGVVGGATSAGALSQIGGLTLSATQYQAAKLFLSQGFLLLPLMGIGPFLLPRFFGAKSLHAFDDSSGAPAGWWPRAIGAMIAGLLIIVSFAIEIHGKPMLGHLLRALTIGGWFIKETTVFQRGKLSSTPGNSVRWALIGLISGCTAAAFWPAARVGTLHLFFAAGLGLVTLTVATRVILGHAGRHELLTGKILWLRWVTGLLVLAAITRLTADFIPSVRVSHHIYAAWSWAIGGVIWLIALSKCLFQTEERPPSNCPRHRHR